MPLTKFVLPYRGGLSRSFPFAPPLSSSASATRNGDRTAGVIKNFPARCRGRNHGKWMRPSRRYFPRCFSLFAESVGGGERKAKTILSRCFLLDCDTATNIAHRRATRKCAGQIKIPRCTARTGLSCRGLIDTLLVQLLICISYNINKCRFKASRDLRHD